jgi:ABC-2 type transport system permease protein
MIRAELRKIRTARTLLAAPLVAVAFAVLGFVPALTLSEAERADLPPTMLVDVARGAGFQLAVLMLLLGALATAGEFRHGTVTATLLAEPRRRTVLAAKAAAVAITAAATAFVIELVALPLGMAYLSASGIRSTASVGDVLLTGLAVAAVGVLYGLAGVGLGLAVRDQTAAIAVALGWIGIAEGVIPVVLRKPWLFKWLPGGAVNAVLGVADPPGDLLPAWGGALMLVAVAAALLLAAAAAFDRRDVA